MVVKFLTFTWRDKIVTISRLGIYTVTPRTTTKETTKRFSQIHNRYIRVLKNLNPKECRIFLKDSK